jgi:MbtH protein
MAELAFLYLHSCLERSLSAIYEPRGQAGTWQRRQRRSMAASKHTGRRVLIVHARPARTRPGDYSLLVHAQQQIEVFIPANALERYPPDSPARPDHGVWYPFSLTPNVATVGKFVPRLLSAAGAAQEVVLVLVADWPDLTCHQYQHHQNQGESRSDEQSTTRFPTVVNVEEKEFIMTEHEEEDKTIYKVVVNHEEQYSIWRADRENPLGWHDAGKSGGKSECLAYIKEVWTDMRPLSLRKQMEELAR